MREPAALHLTGQRILLREFVRSDVDAAHAIVGDPRVTDSLSFDARTRAQTADLLAGIQQRSGMRPRNEYYLAVVVDTTLIGFARLGLTGVRAAKLGYAIHADHWNRGYGTDAARTLVGFGFGVLGLRRISAAIGPANGASIALSERLGFQYEGRLRDHVFTNGGWRDSMLYSVLAPDWRDDDQVPDG